MTMIKRDSFLVHREDEQICIVSKRGNRVLALSAEALCKALTGCARTNFAPRLSAFDGTNAHA
ncbi:hypothetical protein [Hyphomicrobium sp.]|jgi:hypothetical protein|uniref:hypothetical protein n=1 Tax=Hyphomicrobium sp. TaxID=82 RepID=UPI00356A8952